MVDKSTLGLIVFSSLVLLLTFRDLVTTTKQPANKENSNQQNNEELRHVNNENNDFFNNDEANSFNSGSDSLSSSSAESAAASGDGEQFVKKIPSLKMKSNMQTIKFKFW